MALLTIQRPSLLGINPTFAAVAGGGDTVTNDSDNVVLHVKAAAGGSITVSITALTKCNHGTAHNVTHLIPANGQAVIGPFPRLRFGSTISITYIGTTAGATIAAYEAGEYRAGDDGFASVLFKYVPGDNIAALGGTFSRAGSASYKDSAGQLQTASSNTLRDSHWENGVRSTLIEPQSTNSVDFTTISAGNGWGVSQGTLTGSQASPDGTASAVFFNSNSGTANHYIDKNLGSITSGQPIALSIFAKPGTNSYMLLYAEFGGVRAGIHINLSSGVMTDHTAAGGAVISKRISTGWLNGFTRYEVVVTLSTQTTVVYHAALADAGGSEFVDVGTNGVYWWGPQLEKNMRTCTSFIPTSGSTVTRPADDLRFAIGFPPTGGLTVYSKLVDMGAISISAARDWVIGGDVTGTANAMFWHITNGGTNSKTPEAYVTGFVNPGGTTYSPIVLNDVVEWRQWLSADLQTGGRGVSINGGGESTASGATTIPITVNTWHVYEIRLGGGGGGQVPRAAYQKFVVLRGADVAMSTARAA